MCKFSHSYIYLRLIKNYDPRTVFLYKRLEKIKKEDLNVVISNNSLIQEYLRKQLSQKHQQFEKDMEGFE